VSSPDEPLRIPDPGLLLDEGAAIACGVWRSFDRLRPGQPWIVATIAGLLATGHPNEPGEAAEYLAVTADVLDQSLVQPWPPATAEDVDGPIDLVPVA
jgi:hypothetical protein